MLLEPLPLLWYLLDMTPIQLRSKLIESKQAFGRGEITIEQLYAAADAYIAAIRDYAKRTGKRITIPSRAYLIRAV